MKVPKTLNTCKETRRQVKLFYHHKENYGSA